MKAHTRPGKCGGGVPQGCDNLVVKGALIRHPFSAVVSGAEIALHHRRCRSIVPGKKSLALFDIDQNVPSHPVSTQTHFS